MNITKSTLIAGAIGLVVGIGGTMMVNTLLQTNEPDRQEVVRTTGSQVMPFELDRTMHVFTDSTTGGTEQVRAKDPADKSQIDLARGHLREEASKFSKGDFSDPAAIHGQDMPGLSTLQKNAQSIKFTYSDIPGGGQITYESQSKTAIDALHAWFDAQMTDHGSDAMHGHQ